MLAWLMMMSNHKEGGMDAKRTADKYVERGGYAKGERPDAEIPDNC